MKRIRSWIVILLTTALVAACVDPNQEKGICSYLGTCEMGLETYMDFDYCKDLGSCDDGTDPTEYTASGKPYVKTEKEEKSEEKSKKHEEED